MATKYITQHTEGYQQFYETNEMDLIESTLRYKGLLNADNQYALNKTYTLYPRYGGKPDIVVKLIQAMCETLQPLEYIETRFNCEIAYSPKKDCILIEPFID